MFLVGCVAISALPPLNGFVSEWMTFQAILLSPRLDAWALKLLIPAVGALLALSAALAAATFVKAYGVTFLGRPRTPAAAAASETDGFSRAGMFVLAGLCFAAGVLPGFVIDTLAPAVQPLTGGRMPVQAGQAWLTIVPIAEARSSYNGLLVLVFIAASAGLCADHQPGGARPGPNSGRRYRIRTGVASERVDEVLRGLVQSGQARWHDGNRRLVAGETRLLASAAAAALPVRSGVIVGASGPWYVDAASGTVGRIRVRPPAPPPRLPPPPPLAPSRNRAAAPRRRIEPPASSEQVIVERKPTPVLRLTRFRCPDEHARTVDVDALLLDFDYDGVTVAAEDERQFVRAEEPGGPVFVRRDRDTEAAVLDVLRQDGFVQMRMAVGNAAKGRLVFLFRGREAAENWQRFVGERLGESQARDWQSRIDPNFGPRLATSVGACDMRLADAPHGAFSLDLGIEIDGERHPLLPVLLGLRDRGGMAAARVVDGELITSLADGRIVRLPVERIARLLAVVDELVETARRRSGDTLVLDAVEAPAVVELEDLVTARWQDGAAIAARVARFRGLGEIPEVKLPTGFAASLRPYQQHGLNWLQQLRANDLGGLLADDMGLGKTPQTIAHIVVEHAAGRLDRPALVVVPTSLISNWTAEIARFAPGLRVVVLHGADRHERRARLGGVHVVITTYTVLARDIEDMAALAWHMVVLDEAQAVKNASAKATHAVCRLDTRHRLCLSGTPIENNLGELWSLFAFLMPGLLGHRKSFTKRFRTPIEKGGDEVRRRQLALRIRPFILRRSKAAVAPELPPKHTIMRRITLAPEQRELYETIRATLHERVSQEIAAHSLARSQVVVLDALLKLRQVCCDPRLVRLRLGTVRHGIEQTGGSMDMVGEMIAEGRRILLFSQFTSMLDLMKPRLAAAGIPFVELRGDTRDRATRCAASRPAKCRCS